MNFQKSKELWQQQVIADPKLTPRAKIILVAISWHLNRNSRVAWPGFAKLMRVTGNSRSTVIRAVHAGEKLGHLRVIRRRNSATRNAPNRYETLLKRTSGLTPPSVTSDTPLVSPLTPKPLIEPLIEPLPYGIDSRRCSAEDTLRKRSGEEERRPPSLSSSASLTAENCYTFCRKHFSGEEALITKALKNGSAEEVMAGLHEAIQNGWDLRDSLSYLLEDYGRDKWNVRLRTLARCER